MPTAADASLQHESDSDEDLDYVPEGEEEQGSDTSEERDAKRPRVDGPPLTLEDSTTIKSERQALWTKFQDSINAPPVPPESEPKRMIKIEKRHRFAGEVVVEIVDVPEDSTDAKKWPLWKPPPPDSHQDEAATATASNAATSGPAGPSSSTESPPATSVPPTRRPGRRKPKLQLAELPSSSSSADSRKGKKLTTLEKSALDWKAHVNDASSGGGDPELASELGANRRGGGYLEKVEFLRRVGDRKNQALEANKDHKRRR